MTSKKKTLLEEGGAGEDGTNELAARYAAATPGQWTKKKLLDLPEAPPKTPDNLDRPAHDAKRHFWRQQVQSKVIDECSSARKRKKKALMERATLIWLERCSPDLYKEIVGDKKNG